MKDSNIGGHNHFLTISNMPDSPNRQSVPRRQSRLFFCRLSRALASFGAVCTFCSSFGQSYRAESIGVSGGTNVGGITYGLNSAGLYEINDTEMGTQFAYISENSHGTYAGEDGNYTTFVGTSNSITNLSGELGQYSQIWAINDQGSMVGYSEPGIYDVRSRAFVLEGNSVTYLPSLGGGYGEAQAISQNNLVAGSSWLSSGLIDAFLWNGTTTIDLGGLGGSFYFSNTNRTFQSDAWGVNNQGDVVGISWLSNGQRRGFLYSNGAMTNIGTLEAGDASVANAINNGGLVVGQSSTAGGLFHGIAYKDGKLVDLNQVTVGLSSGDSIANAIEVNDAGQILAFDQNGSLYLLNPTPEPSGILAMTCPFVGLFLRRRTRTVG